MRPGRPGPGQPWPPGEPFRAFTDAASPPANHAGGMRKKLLVPLAVVALLVLAVAVPTAAGVPKIPSIPKGAQPVQYPVTIDTAGYINYVWTYDTTEKCSPGYAYTVTEKLTFSSGGPKRGKLAVVYGNAFTTAQRSGIWHLSVKLSDWEETNYCEGKPAKITKPTCHDLSGGRTLFAMAPEVEGAEKGLEPLAPLVRDTTFVISPTTPTAQTKTCYDNRPKVETVGEEEKDWSVDPKSGISVPLAANTNYFRNKLGVGDTLRRHVNIGGRCDRATATASALPPTITSCDIDGHVDVVIRRTGK
jgi:hypothetical protein